MLSDRLNWRKTYLEVKKWYNNIKMIWQKSDENETYTVVGVTKTWLGFTNVNAVCCKWNYHEKVAAVWKNKRKIDYINVKQIWFSCWYCSVQDVVKLQNLFVRSFVHLKWMYRALCVKTLKVRGSNPCPNLWIWYFQQRYLCRVPTVKSLTVLIIVSAGVQWTIPS